MEGVRACGIFSLRRVSALLSALAGERLAVKLCEPSLASARVSAVADVLRSGKEYHSPRSPESECSLERHFASIVCVVVVPWFINSQFRPFHKEYALARSLPSLASARFSVVAVVISNSKECAQACLFEQFVCFCLFRMDRSARGRGEGEGLTFGASYGRMITSALRMKKGKGQEGCKTRTRK